MPRIITAGVLVAGLLASPSALAGDAASGAIASDLSSRIGQPVTLKLASGEELTGIVRRTTGELVHLGELSGREFFDAVVATREVAAVIYRRKR